MQECKKINPIHIKINKYKLNTEYRKIVSTAGNKMHVNLIPFISKCILRSINTLDIMSSIESYLREVCALPYYKKISLSCEYKIIFLFNNKIMQMKKYDISPSMKNVFAIWFYLSTKK